MKRGLCVLLLAAMCVCVGCQKEETTPEPTRGPLGLKQGKLGDLPTNASTEELAAEKESLKAAVAGVNRLKDGKYLLRYVWRKGDIMAWDVTHRNRTVTTVTNTTESVDAACQSEKVWEVMSVDADGAGTFTNTVPWAVMREKRDEGVMRTYDSRRDMLAPEGFESAPESLGVELARITVDARGRQIGREDFRMTTIIQQANQAYVVVPFPEEPVAVGGSWDFKYPVYVPLSDGSLTRIEMMQKYTLTRVEGDIATITYGTKVLMPVQDAGIQAQLMDRLYDGTYLFNLKDGRSQAITQKVEQNVVGFRGAGSGVKMLIEFNEKFQPQPTKHVPVPAAAPPEAYPVYVPQEFETPEEEPQSSLEEVALPPGVLEKL